MPFCLLLSLLSVLAGGAGVPVCVAPVLSLPLRTGIGLDWRFYLLHLHLRFATGCLLPFSIMVNYDPMVK